jgi:hypothetical protein
LADVLGEAREDQNDGIPQMATQVLGKIGVVGGGWVFLAPRVDSEDKAATKDCSLVELEAFTQEKRQTPGFGRCEVHGVAGELFKVFH